MNAEKRNELLFSFCDALRAAVDAFRASRPDLDNNDIEDFIEFFCTINTSPIYCDPEE